MNLQRKIIHMDLDAFYASVEQLDYPDLRGKPVIVGGIDGRGVVATASYEARKFGIHSAMSVAYARKLCPNGYFIKPRLNRYREIAKIIFSIYRRYTELVEPLSLDEAYLDVTENLLNEKTATRLAEIIRNEVKKTTGLTASAGISFNKNFAKIASDMHKPDGIFVIRPDNWEKIILQLPVRKFHGIGEVTEKKMQQNRILTGNDLKQKSLNELTGLFGKNGFNFYNVVRGFDNRQVKPCRIRKSVGVEKTFSNNLDQQEDVESGIRKIVLLFQDRIRKAEIKGKTLTLKIKYDNFQTITRSVSISNCITATSEINDIVLSLYKSIVVDKRKIRLIGVALSNLMEYSPGLFDAKEEILK